MVVCIVDIVWELGNLLQIQVIRYGIVVLMVRESYCRSVTNS